MPKTTGETLRERLKRLRGFTDSDFSKGPQGYAVEVGEDANGSIVLIGKTGNICWATLAFPLGYSISFTGKAENLLPGMDMQIADQGRHPGGKPILILEMVNMPSIGQREWTMEYFCSNVDMTVIY